MQREAAAGLKYGDPCVAKEMIHSDQLAAMPTVAARCSSTRR